MPPIPRPSRSARAEDCPVGLTPLAGCQDARVGRPVAAQARGNPVSVAKPGSRCGYPWRSLPDGRSEADRPTGAGSIAPSCPAAEASDPADPTGSTGSHVLDEPQIQDLINQISQQTDRGASSAQSLSFTPNPQIQALVSQLSGPGGGGFEPTLAPEFADTTGSQRALLQSLIQQLQGESSTLTQTRTLRPGRSEWLESVSELVHSQPQLNAWLRTPSGTGLFDVDSRALREQSGEDIARFAAGRASQRRSEVLGERTAAANAALANLGQIGSTDVARFNSGLARSNQANQAAAQNAATGQDANRTALQALLGQDADRRNAIIQAENRQSQEGQADRASRLALLQQLMGEQARIQGGNAAGAQQGFGNQLTRAGFLGDQAQTNAQNTRQASQDAIQRAIQQRQLEADERRLALEGQRSGTGNRLLELQLQQQLAQQGGTGGGIGGNVGFGNNTGRPPQFRF